MTVLVGSILFGLSHTFHPVGVFSGFLWGIPLALSYVKTRNIYIPMTAHFIANLLMNGLDAIAIFKGIM